jgi:hypothetical protein
LDRVPILLASLEDVAKRGVPAPADGPLNFRFAGIVEPAVPEGLPLMPFFRLHDLRYQMYWQITTAEGLAVRRERLACWHWPPPIVFFTREASSDGRTGRTCIASPSGMETVGQTWAGE